MNIFTNYREKEIYIDSIDVYGLGKYIHHMQELIAFIIHLV